MNDVEVEWGPAFIGSVICMSLYGVTLAQTIFYFKVFPGDSLDLKVLVSSLCIFDTFHIYLLGAVLWTILLKGRAKAAVNLNFEVPWQLLASSAVAYFVTFVVQVYFAIRVWRVLEKRWTMTTIIIIATVAQLGAGTAFVVYNFIDPRTQDDFSDWSGMAQLATSCLCDIAITASLLHYFWTSRVGQKSTDIILNNLIALTINTGLAPCVVAIVALGLYKGPNGSFNAFPSHLTLSKLHVNCLLATLNARRYIRNLADRDFSYTLEDMPGSSQDTNNDTLIEFN